MDPLTTEYVGKYFGPSKIVAIEVLPEKTPSGKMIFSLLLERTINNTPMQYKTRATEKTLALLVGTESKDYTETFHAKINVLVPELVAVIEEYDLDFPEVDLMAQSLKKAINFRFDRALNYVFQGDDSRFVPGWNPMNDVTLLQAEAVISSIPPEDEPAS